MLWFDFTLGTNWYFPLVIYENKYKSKEESKLYPR